MHYEYCVMRSDWRYDPHRGPMSKAEAFAWIKEAEADGIKPGVFFVAHRQVGRWEYTLSEGEY